MKISTPALALFVALTAPACALAQPPPRDAPLLPVSECLDPDRIRSWHFLDSDRILVDAGRRRYLLTLSMSCPELSYEHTVGFRAGNSIGRICGNMGDAIVTPDRHSRRFPCRIATVTPLDKEQFEALRDPVRKQKRGVISVREGDGDGDGDGDDDGKD